MATAELLPALRVQAAAGRALEPSDMHPNAARVAMIGYEFWQRHLGGGSATAQRSHSLLFSTAP